MKKTASKFYARLPLVLKTPGNTRETTFSVSQIGRRQLLAAFHRARAGDTVLLAGKGHEQSIIIGREKIPWDDRQVARDNYKH